MAIYHFSASRVTGGNAIFPDEIIIDTDEQIVTYRKGQLIGHNETRIRFGAIGCVSVGAGILFSDIIIETNGGNTIVANGFTRSDAHRIANILS